MEGEAIEAVKQGLAALHTNLMGDPTAVESAFVSVITFHDTAQQIVPLTEIAQFQPPELDAGGLTALGAALKLLIDCVDREVRRTSNGVKGDWRPLVFIFTDGEPSDAWQEHASQLRGKRLGNIVALACGEQANLDVLRTITDSVYLMRDMSAHSFGQFFRWISSTVTLASQGRTIETPRGLEMPPPPPSVEVVLYS
jgi:uncharacterized protein YegL